jgi:hypothetical protein
MKNCYIARSRSVAARQLGEEMVIMSAQDSTLFNLNPFATLIWLAADGHTPLETIVQERVCSTFEVELEEALQDAQLFVSELAAHGVLLLGETPITDSSAETAKRP